MNCLRLFILISTADSRIKDHVFYSCDGLTNVILPASVTSIGDWAFRYCSGLTSVIFSGNAPTMGLSVFASTAFGFMVGFYSGASGFTAPIWTNRGVTYSTLNLDSSPSAAH